MSFPKSSSGQQVRSGYAPVNGLNLYYEIYGRGMPLVLIHGGGSTIMTTFGMVLGMLAQDRQVIAVELQAHGHTRDIDRALSFEQDADDLDALLEVLQIPSADVFGFSNGGNTALQLAIRHPNRVRRLIAASTFYRREGVNPELWSFMQNATPDNMPAQLKEAFLAINPDTAALRIMHDRDKKRMLDFSDWPDEALTLIKSPVLILIGDRDIIKPEHAVKMYRLIPQAQLLILPGGHGEYIGEITTGSERPWLPATTVSAIRDFLK